MAEYQKLLEDKDTLTSVLLLILERKLGEQFINYEFESIWYLLEEYNIPDINKDKIRAAINLLTSSNLFFDAVIFEKTINALNNIETDPKLLQEAQPQHLCWGIKEITILLDEGTLQWDREPLSYTAIVLHRNGFVKTPDILNFAQEELEKLNKQNLDLPSGTTEAQNNKQEGCSLYMSTMETLLKNQLKTIN